MCVSNCAAWSVRISYLYDSYAWYRTSCDVTIADAHINAKTIYCTALVCIKNLSSYQPRSLLYNFSLGVLLECGFAENLTVLRIFLSLVFHLWLLLIASDHHSVCASVSAFHQRDCFGTRHAGDIKSKIQNKRVMLCAPLDGLIGNRWIFQIHDWRKILHMVYSQKLFVKNFWCRIKFQSLSIGGLKPSRTWRALDASRS